MRRLIRLSLSAVAIVSAGLLLAACTITSVKPLLADSEGATPLPDSFAFMPYERADSGDNSYVRSTDKPATFTRDGNHYIAKNVPDSKGPIDFRFLPLGKDFLVAGIVPDSPPGIVYAFAHYDPNGVLAVSLSPGDEARDALAAHPIPGVTVSSETDAITIADRAGLDALAKMYQDGKLPMGKPSVAYLAKDATTKPPAKISVSGGVWTVTP